MNLLNKLFTISMVSLTVTNTAHADIRINGFANLVGGITSSDDQLYGFTDKIDFSQQSVFAIQIGGDVNEKITATAQIVARGDDDFKANFDWAYLTYNATDNTSVSMGRLRMPLFRYSASLDVGYSYHWITAPQSVYDVPFNNIDGIRVDHSGYSGDWEYNFQVAFGNINNDFVLAGEIGNLTVDNVGLVTAEITYESWKVRGVYAAGKATFDIPAFDVPFAQLAQISAELSEGLAATQDTGIFYGATIEYDTLDWFVAAEYTGTEIEDSFYPKETNYYVTAGVRTGKWTPFITYEKSDLNRDAKYVDGIANFPEPFQLPLTQLVVGIQQAVKSENSTTSLGVRYDFGANIALKAAVSKNTNDITDEKDTLLRFAVNYVF